jgi:sialidase-1
MKKSTLLISCLLTFFSIVQAQKQKVIVFASGNDGYANYRIPAMIRLPDGELLAFCEGRVHDAGDFGDIDIVMKRSKDGGRTWSPLQKVADNGSLQAGNPAPVLDMTDPAYPAGRLFLFYNTGNNQEGEVRKGKGLREVWYKTSVDGGVSWSSPVNITLQVHKPAQPAIDTAYHFTEDWRSYANTPGHAVQFPNGLYKGRIYVAANHSAGHPLPHFTDYRAHGYYTDDHGKTFHLSEDVPAPGGNESMAALLPPDALMMNIRDQSGNVKARIVAISHDGGVHWDTVYSDRQLPDPVCQGSILTLGSKKGRNILAFCNAANTTRRDDLTLRISKDNGMSWNEGTLIDKSPDGKGSYTAYSDIVSLGKHAIGVLYENENYSRIVFTKVPI